MSDVALPETALVESIVADVFAGLLGVADLPVPQRTAGTATGDVVATVLVRGTWRGHVTVCCTSACARTVAGLMFGADAGELSAADVADAAGELVNVVGGNLKAAMPGPSRLSLPSVHLDAKNTPKSSGPTLTLPMRWRDEFLTVEVSSAPRGRRTS